MAISRLLENAGPVGSGGAVARVAADPLHGVQMAVEDRPMDRLRPKVVGIGEGQPVLLHKVPARRGDGVFL